MPNLSDLLKPYLPLELDPLEIERQIVRLNYPFDYLEIFNTSFHIQYLERVQEHKMIYPYFMPSLNYSDTQTSYDVVDLTPDTLRLKVSLSRTERNGIINLAFEDLIHYRKIKGVLKNTFNNTSLESEEFLIERVEQNHEHLELSLIVDISTLTEIKKNKLGFFNT